MSVRASRPTISASRLPPWIELDVDLVGALDDVVVGDDVAVGRDDEARAERAGALLAARRVRPGGSMKSRKKSSKGEPGGITGRIPSSTSATVVVVVMLTTAGLSRSESSAKLSGTKRGPGSTVSGAGSPAAGASWADSGAASPAASARTSPRERGPVTRCTACVLLAARGTAWPSPCARNCCRYPSVGRLVRPRLSSSFSRAGHPDKGDADGHHEAARASAGAPLHRRDEGQRPLDMAASKREHSPSTMATKPRPRSRSPVNRASLRRAGGGGRRRGEPPRRRGWACRRAPASAGSRRRRCRARASAWCCRPVSAVL